MIINMQSAGGSGSSPTLQTKSKTYTPTTSQQTEHITADAGFDGLAAVDVEVEAISPTKAAATYYPSSSEQSVGAGQWLTGAQTFKGVVLTNLLASNIKNGVTVQVGDAQKLNRIAEITGTYSGGASNIVTGTFTTQSSTGTQSVTVEYNGSGYPIAMVVFPDVGSYNSSDTTFYSIIKRYALQIWAMIKSNTTLAPTYPSSADSGQANGATVITRYKNSTSSATSYGTSGADNTGVFTTAAVSANSNGRLSLRFSTAKLFRVFVAASSYGFLANMTYRYVILYSS